VNVSTNVGNGWAPLYLVGFVKPISSVYKLWPKISGRRGRPHQPFFFSEN